MGKFSGEATLSFSFRLHSQCESNLKRICCISILDFGRTISFREANRSLKLFPFVKMVERRANVPIYLNTPFQAIPILSLKSHLILGYAQYAELRHMDTLPSFSSMFS